MTSNLKVREFPTLSGTSTSAVNATLQALSGTSATHGTYTLKPTKAEAEVLFGLLYLKCTTETFALAGSSDGTNFSAALKPVDASTGVEVTAATLATGNYIIPNTWPYSQYKLTKSAGVNASFSALAWVTVPK